MRESVYDVLSNTPPGVWMIFIYLTWIGVLRLRPSVRQLGKIWMTPAIFIVWGVVGLFRRPGDFPVVLMHWAIGAVVGGALGSVGGMKLTVDRPRQLILLRGSTFPLLRIFLVFGAHFVLQVAAALHPDQAAWRTADIYVSGASAGYFIGWSARFLQSYREAPQADLAPVVSLRA